MKEKGFLKPRVWTITDIACVKWSSILFGALVGAYWSDFIKGNAWIVVILMLALAVRPVVHMFAESEQA